MKIYGCMAAAQQGRAFYHLGRRYQIGERAAGEVVRLLLPELLACLHAWTTTPEGMASFLSQLSGEDYLRIYHETNGISDRAARELGLALIIQLVAARQLSLPSLENAAKAVGLEVNDIARMLPAIVVLMVAAIRIVAEGPFRQTLSRLENSPQLGNAVPDPFARLAQIVRQSGRSSAERRNSAVEGFPLRGLV